MSKINLKSKNAIKNNSLLFNAFENRLIARLVHIFEKYKIPINNKTYINEPFTFDETTYDLLSLAYYNKNNIDKALECIDKALEINPYSDRLIKNKEIISNK